VTVTLDQLIPALAPAPVKAAVSDYVAALQARQSVIAQKLGVDLDLSDKTVRVMNMAWLTVAATFAKVLVDKAILTDFELMALLDEIRDSAYDDVPIDPF
jgi:hypothetical protein